MKRCLIYEKMKSLKKFMCLLAMVSVSLWAFCEEDAYQNETEQKALKMAYEMLKVYYPNGELCVSDSIWDENDWYSFISVIKKKDQDFFDNFRMNKGWKYDKPVYSEHIANIFKSEIYDPEKLKYFADFSRPYRGYFLCEIMPLDRQVGIFGSPTTYLFMFHYDENGDIVRLIRQLLHYD